MRLLLAAFVLCCFLGNSEGATTVWLSGSTYIETTWIDGLNPTTNYSESDPNVTWRSASNAMNAKILMTIKPLGLPTGIVITDAQLWITGVDWPDEQDITVDIHRVLQDMTVGGATWNKYDGASDWNAAGCGTPATDFQAGILGSKVVPSGLPIVDSLRVDGGVAAFSLEVNARRTQTWHVVLQDVSSPASPETFEVKGSGAASDPPRLIITYNTIAATPGAGLWWW